LNDVAKVLGGELTGGDAEITSVSTDTRTLKPGALFVAVDGERFQGSDFVSDAERSGAAAVLTGQPNSSA
jgi:UDP-N-acetylmuramoyl-tripeptide--D-alanyl-D-alanine ligase